MHSSNKQQLFSSREELYCSNHIFVPVLLITLQKHQAVLTFSATHFCYPRTLSSYNLQLVIIQLKLLFRLLDLNWNNCLKGLMLLENITQQQIEQFRQAFALFDKDGDGVINNKELKTILRSLGYYLTKQELDLFIAMIDEDGSGTIDFRQFLLVISKSFNDNNLEDGMVQAFKISDKNQDGKLSKIELKSIVQQTAETNQQFDRILNILDDGQGLIDIEKYIKYALQVCQSQIEFQQS